MIGYYAVDDLNAYGIQLIIKSRSKISWWISKTIWCMLSVTLYFVVLFAAFAVFALASGKGLMGDSRNWCNYAGVYREVEINELVIHGILIPALTIFALCMLQMLISILFGALPAYIGVISYNILSAYITHPLFIGNYTILSLIHI